MQYEQILQELSASNKYLDKQVISLTSKVEHLLIKLHSQELQLQECCNTAIMVEKALAHKKLSDTIKTLYKNIEDMKSIKEEISKHTVPISKIEDLVEDVNKFKVYAGIAAGALLALELFGVLDKFKGIL